MEGDSISCSRAWNHTMRSQLASCHGREKYWLLARNDSLNISDHVPLHKANIVLSEMLKICESFATTVPISSHLAMQHL